jgi:site-specific recombinase XerC
VAARCARPGAPRNAAGAQAHERKLREAADQWLRYVEHDRDCKPSTLSDYRSVAKQLVAEFGEMRVEDITTQRIEKWRAGQVGLSARQLSNRTRNKSLAILGAIMERARKVYGLPSNPARDVEKLRERYDAAHFDFTPSKRSKRSYGRRRQNKTARYS